MGQIYKKSGKLPACNLRSLSQFGVLTSGQHVLVCTSNTATEDGQGVFDCYVVGDGETSAESLTLHYIESHVVINGCGYRFEEDEEGNLTGNNEWYFGVKFSELFNYIQNGKAVILLFADDMDGYPPSVGTCMRSGSSLAILVEFIWSKFLLFVSADSDDNIVVDSQSEHKIADASDVSVLQSQIATKQEAITDGDVVSISEGSSRTIKIHTTDSGHVVDISAILGTADKTYNLGGWDHSGDDSTLLTKGAIKQYFYQKPSTGIPKTDLASAVQTSLDKADTALQEHQDISGKADTTALAAEATARAEADAFLQSQIDNKQATLTFDSKPTRNSTNPLTSAGVLDAISPICDIEIIPSGSTFSFDFGDLTFSDIENAISSEEKVWIKAYIDPDEWFVFVFADYDASDDPTFEFVSRRDGKSWHLILKQGTDDDIIQSNYFEELATTEQVATKLAATDADTYNLAKSGTTYADVLTAVAAVPSSYRKLGLHVIYLDSDSNTQEVQFIGSAISLWSTSAEFWTNITDALDLVGRDLTYTPTYSVTDGSYINCIGGLSTNSSFHRTSAFKVTKGSTITFVGKANGNIACIAKTDSSESYYSVLMVGTSNSTVGTYTATVSEDCYIVISYYTVTSISVQSVSTITSLKEDTTSLKTYATDILDLQNQLGSVVLDSYYYINSEENSIDIDTITLYEDGDSIETVVDPLYDTSSQAFPFTKGGSSSGIGFGVSRGYVSLRLDNSTWAFSNFDISSYVPSSGSFKVKIAYENSVINLYVDDTLVSTYNGQGTVNLSKIGTSYTASGTTYYWVGKLYSFVYTSGGVSISLERLSGFTLNDLGMTCVKDYSDVLLPKIHVSATESNVAVYFKITGNTYGKLDVGHEVNTGTDETSESARNPNTDYWRINSYGGLYTYADGTFTSLSTSIIVAAENEFAIAFAGMNTYSGSGDFTGGYHGNERIDLNDDCYVSFIVNGVEYTISELVAIGEIDCDTFAYRELSELYTSYNYLSLQTHTAFAKHLKLTTFGNNGYKTRNYVKLDLSNLDATSLTINTAFTGLVCIHKNFANKIVGDDGTIYTGTNPSTTTTLASVLDYYTREMRASNGNYSCFLDSSLLGTDISGFASPAIDVRVMDRANDNKYYSYLPSYASMADGEFFATECEVHWFVNE